MAETKFHTKYQDYNEAVIGKTWQEISITKTSMFKLSVQQIKYILSIQFIITATIFLIGILIFPRLGFGGSVLIMYPTLVAAFLTIFLMYCNIIFMFYFNDNKSAKYTSLVFCLAVLLGSLISVRLTESFYGLGAFIGGFIGWTFSFFRLKYIEKNFDEHIFCDIEIVETHKNSIPVYTVYGRRKNG